MSDILEKSLTEKTSDTLNLQSWTCPHMYEGCARSRFYYECQEKCGFKIYSILKDKDLAEKGLRKITGRIH